MNLRLTAAVFILLAGSPLAAFAQPAAKAQPEPVQPLPLIKAPVGAEDPVLINLLDKIEAADGTLIWLNAPIRLVRRFPDIQGGGEHTRYGNIWYASEAAPKTSNAQPGQSAQPPQPAPLLRRFALKFETLDIKGSAKGEVVRREDKQSFTFDGVWLLETREIEKFFARRRIVAPGVIKDPVRIGEGPFPLPVGQRKADMLARFDISIVDPLENAPDNARLRTMLNGCVQLKLVPKVDTPGARDFREIRLWYRLGDFMPIYAQTINLDESSAEVFIILNEGWNTPFDPAIFTTTPPKIEDGWKGDVIEQVPGQAPAAP